MALSSYRIPFLIPYFVEMQRKSFLNFLNIGLNSELSKKNPIYDSFKNFKINFYPDYYQLGLPDYTPKTAILKFKTYASKLYIPIRYTNWKTRQSKLQWIILANLPLMTKRGNFIINGAPRIIINQIVRSPGIYYKKRIDKKKREIYYADLISQRGAWLRFEIDKKKRIWVQMKKTRKIPILIFFKALGISNFKIKQTIKYSNFLENSKLITEKIEKEDYSHPKTFKDSLLWIYTFVYPQKKRTGGINQVSLKKAKKFLFRKFFSYRTYDLGNSGRFQLNKKFNLFISHQTSILTAQDLLFAVDYLIKVEKNIGLIDDIDHLKNRRVRTCGELIQNQFGTGFIRLEKFITDKTQDLNLCIDLNSIFSVKSVDGALREFFGSSPLSQFMDQTNPLAELTHKRRISSLGPGGVSRETAGMEVRGIHPSHYSRICPIETPEGKNAGLVNSLTTLAKINYYGLIKTPFYNIYKGQVQKWKSATLLSPNQEQYINIAPGDLQLNYFYFLPKNKIFVKHNDKFKQLLRNKIEYMCVSVIQMISIATSLIPFLEHDDANRALMGSNMQRQAVPLILPERPAIGTGLEPRVISDSGHGIQSKNSGKVFTITSKNIMVTDFQLKNYNNIYSTVPKPFSKTLNKQSFTENFRRNFSKAFFPRQKPETFLFDWEINCAKRLKTRNNFFFQQSSASEVFFTFKYIYDLTKKNISAPKVYNFAIKVTPFIYIYNLNINYKKSFSKRIQVTNRAKLDLQNFAANLFIKKNRNKYYNEFKIYLNLLEKYSCVQTTLGFKSDCKTHKLHKIYTNSYRSKKVFFKNSYAKLNKQNFQFEKNLKKNCKKNYVQQSFVGKKKLGFFPLEPNFASFVSQADYVFFKAKNCCSNWNMNCPLTSYFVPNEKIIFMPLLKILVNKKSDVLQSNLKLKSILSYTIKQFIIIFLRECIKLIFLQNFIEKKNIKHVFFYAFLNWQNFNVQRFSKTYYFSKNIIQWVSFFKNRNVLGYSDSCFKHIFIVNLKTSLKFGFRKKKKIKLNCTKIQKFKNYIFEKYIQKKLIKNVSYFFNIFLNDKIVIDSKKFYFYLNLKNSLIYLLTPKIENICCPFFKNKIILLIFNEILLTKKNLLNKVNKYFVVMFCVQKIGINKILISQFENLQILKSIKIVKKPVWVLSSDKKNIVINLNKFFLQNQKKFTFCTLLEDKVFANQVRNNSSESNLSLKQGFFQVVKVKKKLLAAKLCQFSTNQNLRQFIEIFNCEQIAMVLNFTNFKISQYISVSNLKFLNALYLQKKNFQSEKKASLFRCRRFENFVAREKIFAFFPSLRNKYIFNENIFFTQQNSAERSFFSDQSFTSDCRRSANEVGFEQISNFAKQNLQSCSLQFNNQAEALLSEKNLLRSCFAEVFSESKTSLLDFFKYQNRITNFNLKCQFQYLNKIINYSILTYQHSNQNTCINQTPLISHGEWIQKGDVLADGAASVGGDLSLGKSILVAYMPWEGYNFEDAILVNERLIYDDLYTSIHIEKYKTEICDTPYGIEKITVNIPHISYKQKLKLDSNGIIKIGSWVSTGDILVGKVTPIQKKRISGHAKLLADILEKKNYTSNVRDTSLRVPKHVSGRIVHIEQLENEKISFNAQKKQQLNSFQSPKRVHIYIAEKRKIQIGDKMSGRHGNKGIISNILPQQDMPYLSDGTPIDMVLNPLGVPSRMNVGQIFECLLGLASNELNEQVRISIFDEMNGAEATRSLTYAKLFDARLKTGKQWLFNLNSPGKMTVFDGRTGESFKQNATVGKAYMLKLVHLVDEKIHARSTGPYSLVTQQPLRGRSKHGGQRLGEMEVWALEGFGAAYTLQELLTSKSDDMKGRHQVMQAILERKSILLGTPESFKVLLSELQSLCLNIGVYSIANSGIRKKIDIMQFS